MNYLITGIAGSGKSTLAAALSAAGYEAVDPDKRAHWVERATGKSIEYRPDRFSRTRSWLERVTGKSFAGFGDRDWLEKHDWVWKEGAMEALLRRERDHDLFVCGIAHNQASFYRLFDGIFLLSIEAATVQHRLRTRTNNPFGRNPGDIEHTLGVLEEFEAQARRAGAIVIDASRPPGDVLPEILEHVRRYRKPESR